ncbi:hypothetical protein QYF61_021347 [Mycteria americana]|nr:hypothetical protein QYF61_021347 [Mycteria americana]
MVAYLNAPFISSLSLNVVVAVLYSVVPPAVNPLIYSFRDKELKDAWQSLHAEVEGKRVLAQQHCQGAPALALSAAVLFYIPHSLSEPLCGASLKNKPREVPSRGKHD